MSDAATPSFADLDKMWRVGVGIGLVLGFVLGVLIGLAL